MKKTALTLALLATLPFSSINAEEYREHGAHVHGQVELNMAQDGQHLLIEVTAPGADVVGFEHAPQNADQKAVITRATTLLNDPSQLFSFNIDCKLEEAVVSNTLESEHGDGHDHHNHGDHKDHDHDDHSHDDHDHGDHKGHDHDDHGHDDHDHGDHKGHDHDDHGHDDHNHGNHKGHDHDDHGHNHGHGEFSAQYVYECNNMESLKTVDVNWFNSFPSTEKMTVQAITNSAQFADTLTSQQHRIQF